MVSVHGAKGEKMDKLISADSLWMTVIRAMDYCEDILEFIEEEPEAVVRCKDCSYCEKVKQFGKVYHYCEAFEQYAEGDLIGVSLQVNPDHFCSWGERREDAETN